MVLVFLSSSSSWRKKIGVPIYRQPPPRTVFLAVVEKSDRRLRSVDRSLRSTPEIPANLRTSLRTAHLNDPDQFLTSNTGDSGLQHRRLRTTPETSANLR